jgi:ATP-dependent helicase/nuclease subunit A
VQGIIDCYFTEGEDIVLIDYKSNRINGDHIDEEINRIKALYLKQIKIYKEALEKGLNKKVKGSYLYLFTAGRFIDMD